MLIREMAFIFHKSKQAKTRAKLKKLSKTINSTEFRFSFNHRFRGEVVMGQI